MRERLALPTHPCGEERTGGERPLRVATYGNPHTLPSGLWNNQGPNSPGFKGDLSHKVLVGCSEGMPA